ncbi:MAG: adenylate/guanylate cyclase domain-containing protein, partial [Proteobacteria bacterium]|nr:adenylate/guanylate cyclase domain-containing protein [Pseudomonadota bacterium]
MFGWLPYNHYRRGKSGYWPRYAYPLADMALITFTLLFPNPFSDQIFGPYPALALRFGNEVYFFILIASTVFYYSPRICLWGGFSAALAWSAGTLWIASSPETIFFDFGRFGDLATGEQLDYYFQPNLVNLQLLVTQGIVFMLVAILLATLVWRTRALVLTHAQAERARSNLARHFSPTMVDELANMDEPFGAGRSQQVGVLFADVVGFTGFAETKEPSEVLSILREILSMMAEQVFAHDGTIDKYLGDGIMATFGTPHKGEHDASNALACARGILEDAAKWNEVRVKRGETPLHIGVGVHYGPVVLGDIGDE